MKYYYNVKVKDGFSNTIERVASALSKEGFGILTEINVKEIFRKKLDIEFPEYIILGACNPQFAYKAFQSENKIGTMLPCNVIIRDAGDGFTEVAAIDPTEAMKPVENSSLADIAVEVKERLVNALNNV